MIRKLEEAFNKPLHWIICLLHFAELPLRHLFSVLDGQTNGPKSFTGPIGRMLNDCETRNPQKFKKFFTDSMPVLPQNVMNDLSKDQRYLYDIVHAIQSGTINASLKDKKPGPICMARWLTLACRILRLYVSFENPPEELFQLAEFVMKVYAPMWFLIKLKPHICDGPKHFFRIITETEYMPTELRNVVIGVAQRNAYFAHQENVILAMLGDENETVREMAVKSILAARRLKIPAKLRKFKLPEINFNAQVYYEMTTSNQPLNLEPPVTKGLPKSTLLECIQNGNFIRDLIGSIPCHSQAVERSIKLVSETSKVVSGEANRNAIVYTKLASRKILPQANTKSDYKLFFEQENVLNK